MRAAAFLAAFLERVGSLYVSLTQRLLVQYGLCS